MNDAATFYTNRVLKDYKNRYVAKLQYPLAREQSINHTSQVHSAIMESILWTKKKNLLAVV